MLGTFLTITPEDVSSTISYAKNLIGDLMPLLVVIIGIGLALFIYEAIVSRRH